MPGKSKPDTGTRTKQNKQNKQNKKIFFGKVLFITLFVSIGFIIIKNFDAVNDKRAELEELLQVEENLRIRNEELTERLHAEIDDEYIKKVAKEKLGYREPNSIIFHIHLE